MIVHVCDWCNERITPGQPFVTETTQTNVMVSDGAMTIGDVEIHHYHDGPVESEPIPSTTNSAAPPCYWHHGQ